MNNDELRIQARIWVTGGMIIMAASIIWIVLAVLAGDYYSSTKVVRDTAEAGSGLLSQLATIQGLQAWLLPFSFLLIQAHRIIRSRIYLLGVSRTRSRHDHLFNQPRDLSNRGLHYPPSQIDRSLRSSRPDPARVRGTQTAPADVSLRGSVSSASTHPLAFTPTNASSLRLPRARPGAL